MKIETILSVAERRLVTVDDKTKLTEVAACLGGDHTDIAVVCDENGRMVGVVTKTDIVSRIGACEGHACTTMAASVMSQDVAYCHPGDSVQTAWDIMKEKRHLHIPIVDSDHYPLGILYAQDVLQELLRETEYEEDLLRDYVSAVGYQ